MNKVKCLTVHFLFQSPSNALVSDGVSENPNLKDNWDDAEGYYREYTRTTVVNQIQHMIQFDAIN